MNDNGLINALNLANQKQEELNNKKFAENTASLIQQNEELAKRKIYEEAKTDISLANNKLDFETNLRINQLREQYTKEKLANQYNIQKEKNTIKYNSSVADILWQNRYGEAKEREGNIAAKLAKSDIDFNRASSQNELNLKQGYEDTNIALREANDLANLQNLTNISKILEPEAYQSQIEAANKKVATRNMQESQAEFADVRRSLFEMAYNSSTTRWQEMDTYYPGNILTGSLVGAIGGTARLADSIFSMIDSGVNTFANLLNGNLGIKSGNFTMFSDILSDLGMNYDFDGKIGSESFSILNRLGVTYGFGTTAESLAEMFGIGGVMGLGVKGLHASGFAGKTLERIKLAKANALAKGDNATVELLDNVIKNYGSILKQPISDKLWYSMLGSTANKIEKYGNIFSGGISQGFKNILSNKNNFLPFIFGFGADIYRRANDIAKERKDGNITLNDAFAGLAHAMVDYTSAFQILNTINKIKGPTSALTNAIGNKQYGVATGLLTMETIGNASFEGIGEMLQTYFELQGKYNYSLPSLDKVLTDNKYEKLKEQILEAGALGAFGGAVIGAGADIATTRNELKDIARDKEIANQLAEQKRNQTITQEVLDPTRVRTEQDESYQRNMQSIKNLTEGGTLDGKSAKEFVESSSNSIKNQQKARKEIDDIKKQFNEEESNDEAFLAILDKQISEAKNNPQSNKQEINDLNEIRDKIIKNLNIIQLENKKFSIQNELLHQLEFMQENNDRFKTDSNFRFSIIKRMLDLMNYEIKTEKDGKKLSNDEMVNEFIQDIKQPIIDIVNNGDIANVREGFERIFRQMIQDNNDIREATGQKPLNSGTQETASNQKENKAESDSVSGETKQKLSTNSQGQETEIQNAEGQETNPENIEKASKSKSTVNQKQQIDDYNQLVFEAKQQNISDIINATNNLDVLLYALYYANENKNGNIISTLEKENYYFQNIRKFMPNLTDEDNLVNYDTGRTESGPLSWLSSRFEDYAFLPGSVFNPTTGEMINLADKKGRDELTNLQTKYSNVYRNLTNIREKHNIMSLLGKTWQEGIIDTNNAIENTQAAIKTSSEAYGEIIEQSEEAMLFYEYLATNTTNLNLRRNYNEFTRGILSVFENNEKQFKELREKLNIANKSIANLEQDITLDNLSATLSSILPTEEFNWLNKAILDKANEIITDTTKNQKEKNEEIKQMVQNYINTVHNAMTDIDVNIFKQEKYIDMYNRVKNLHSDLNNTIYGGNLGQSNIKVFNKTSIQIDLQTFLKYKATLANVFNDLGVTDKMLTDAIQKFIEGAIGQNYNTETSQPLLNLFDDLGVKIKIPFSRDGENYFFEPNFSQLINPDVNLLNAIPEELKSRYIKNNNFNDVFEIVTDTKTGKINYAVRVGKANEAIEMLNDISKAILKDQSLSKGALALNTISFMSKYRLFLEAYFAGYINKLINSKSEQNEESDFGDKNIELRTIQEEVGNFAFDMLGLNNQFDESGINSNLKNEMTKAFLPIITNMVENYMKIKGKSILETNTKGDTKNITRLTQEANEYLRSRFGYYFMLANKLPKHNAMFNGIYATKEASLKQWSRVQNKMNAITDNQQDEIRSKSSRANKISKNTLIDMLTNNKFTGISKAQINAFIDAIEKGTISHINDESFEKIKKEYKDLSIEDRNNMPINSHKNPFNYIEMMTWNDKKQVYEKNYYYVGDTAYNLGLTNNNLNKILDINLDSLTSPELIDKALDKSLTRKREFSDAIFVYASKSNKQSNSNQSKFYTGDLDFERGVYYSHTLLPVGRVTAENTRFNIMTNKFFRGITEIENTTEETKRFNNFIKLFNKAKNEPSNQNKSTSEIIISLVDDDGNNIGLEFFNDFMMINMLVFDEDKVKHNLNILKQIEKEVNDILSNEGSYDAERKIVVRNEVIRKYGNKLLDFKYKIDKNNKVDLAELFTEMLNGNRQKYNEFKNLVNNHLDLSSYDRATASIATSIINRWDNIYSKQNIDLKELTEGMFGWADGTATGMIENILHTTLEPAVAMLSRAYISIVESSDIRNSEDIKNSVESIISEYYNPNNTQTKATTLVQVLELETKVADTLSKIIGEDLEKKDIYALIAAGQRATLKPIAETSNAVKFLLDANIIDRDGVKKMVNKPVYSGSELFVLFGDNPDKPNDFFLSALNVLNTSLNKAFKAMNFSYSLERKIDIKNYIAVKNIYNNFLSSLDTRINSLDINNKDEFKEIESLKMFKRYIEFKYDNKPQVFINDMLIHKNGKYQLAYDKVFNDLNQYFKKEIMFADKLHSKLNFGTSPYLLNFIQAKRLRNQSTEKIEADIDRWSKANRVLSTENVTDEDLDNIIKTIYDKVSFDNSQELDEENETQNEDNLTEEQKAELAKRKAEINEIKKYNDVTKQKISRYIDSNDKFSHLTNERKAEVVNAMFSAILAIRDLKLIHRIKGQDVTKNYSILHMFANQSVEQAFQPISPVIRANKYSNDIMSMLRDYIAPTVLSRALDAHLLKYLNDTYPEAKNIVARIVGNGKSITEIIDIAGNKEEHKDLIEFKNTLAATNNKIIADLHQEKNRYTRQFIKEVVVDLVENQVMSKIASHKNSEDLAKLKQRIRDAVGNIITSKFLDTHIIKYNPNHSVVTITTMNNLSNWIGDVAPLINQTLEANVVTIEYLKEKMKGSVYDELISAIGNISNTAKGWNIGFTRVQNDNSSKGVLLSKFADKIIEVASKEDANIAGIIQEKGFKETFANLKEKALQIFLTTGQTQVIYMKNIMNAVSNSEDMFFDTLSSKKELENKISDKESITNMFSARYNEFNEWRKEKAITVDKIQSAKDAQKTLDFRNNPQNRTLLADIVQYIMDKNNNQNMSNEEIKQQIGNINQTEFEELTIYLHNKYNAVFDKDTYLNNKQAKENMEDFAEKYNEIINEHIQTTKNFEDIYFGSTIKFIQKVLKSIGINLKSNNIKVYDTLKTKLITLDEDNNILKKVKLRADDIIKNNILGETNFINLILNEDINKELTLEEIINLRKIQQYRAKMKEFIENSIGKDNINYNEESQTFSLKDSGKDFPEHSDANKVLNSWNIKIKEKSTNLSNVMLDLPDSIIVNLSNGENGIQLNNNTVKYSELYYDENLEESVTSLIAEAKKTEAGKSFLQDYKTQLSILESQNNKDIAFIIDNGVATSSLSFLNFDRLGVYEGKQDLYIGENIIDKAIKDNLDDINPNNNNKLTNSYKLSTYTIDSLYGEYGDILYSKGSGNVNNRDGNFYQTYEETEEEFFNALDNDIKQISAETSALNPFISLANKIGRGIAKYTQFYRQNSNNDSYFASNYKKGSRNAKTMSKIVITNRANKYTRLHELFHALTYHAQHSNNPKTKFLIRQLDEFINIVLNDFENNPILQEQIFGSTKQYRDYFRTVKSYRIEINGEVKEYVSDIAAMDSIRQEFIAVSGSNPRFANYLAKKTFNKAQIKRMERNAKLANQNMLGRLMTYSRWLIGTISSLVFETFTQDRDYNGVEVMTELIESLAQFNEFQEPSSYTKNMNKANQMVRKALDLATFNIFDFIDKNSTLTPEQRAERKEFIRKEVAEATKENDEFIKNMVKVAQDSGVSAARVIATAAYTILRLTFSKLMLSAEHREVYLEEIGKAMAEILDGTALDFSEFFINFKNYKDNNSFVGKVKRMVDEVHGINQIYEIEKEQEYTQTKNTIQALIKSKQNLMKKLDTPEKMQRFEEGMTAIILNVKIYDNIVFDSNTNNVKSRQDYILTLMNAILDGDSHSIKFLIDKKRNSFRNLFKDNVEYQDLFINELHSQLQELAITRLTRLEGLNGVQNAEMAMQNAYKKVMSKQFSEGKITEQQLLDYNNTLYPFENYLIANAHQLATLQTTLFAINGISGKEQLTENVNYTKDKIKFIKELARSDLYGKTKNEILDLARTFSTIALEYQKQQSHESSINYEIAKGFYESKDGKDLLLDKDTEKHIFTQRDKYLYGKNGAWYKDNHIDYGFNQETSIKVLDLRTENNGKTKESLAKEEEYLKSIGYVEYKRTPYTAIYVYNFKFINPNNPTKIFGHKRYNDQASGKVTGMVYDEAIDDAEKPIFISDYVEIRNEDIKELYKQKTDFIDSEHISNNKQTAFLDDIPAPLAGSKHLFRSNISQKHFETMSNVDTSISNLLGNTASNIYEKNHQARNNTAVWYNVLGQQKELLKRIPKDPNRKAHHMVAIAHIIPRAYRDTDGYMPDKPQDSIIQFDAEFQDKYKVNFTSNDARDLMKLMQATGFSYKNGDTIYVDTRFIAMLFGYKVADLTDSKWAKERPQLAKIVKGIQTFLRIGVKETKANEVIRNPMLVAKNYISNILGLWALGVPANEITNGLAFFHKELENYFDDYQEKIKIETELDAYKRRINDSEAMTKKKELQDRLSLLKGRLAANKMYPLIKEGLYTNIVEDADTADNLDKKILDMLQDKGVLKEELRNSSAGTVLGELTMTPTSESYNFLARWTRYGDIVPRAILYYNRLANGSSHKEAINETRNVYISYASPLYGKTLRNLDHYGFTYYMKYHTNVIPVVLNTFKSNPIKSLLVMSAQLGLNISMLQSYLVDNALIGALTDSKLPIGTPNIMHIGSLNRFKNIF